MKALLAIVLLAAGWLAAPCPVVASEPLVGRWAGTASSASERTEVAIDLRADGATLSLPKVGVLDWPAQSSTIEGDRVSLAFQSDSGTQQMTLSLRDGALQGAWSDPRFASAASLHLTRKATEPTVREQRVQIKGPAGHLGASLLVPEGRGPFPGVVFLHGSGPQPRDASRFHARELARRGIAALIFDKRGVGESTGSTPPIRFDDLAADAIAAATWLRAQPAVSRVGFHGHSQGGWIAPLAASRWPSTAFVIASSAPLVSPMRESQWEVVRRMREAGIDEAQVERARGVIEDWYEAMNTQAWAGFDHSMLALRSEPWFAASGLGDFAEHPDAAQAAAYLSDHGYDPLPALHGMQAPALWVLSPDDESIDAMETVGLLEQEIAAGRDIRLKRYPGYDHSLRRLGADGAALRWPTLPDDLFDVQADFIKARSTGTR
jgi:alpha/beta superfamily hydrolase